MATYTLPSSRNKKPDAKVLFMCVGNEICAKLPGILLLNKGANVLVRCMVRNVCERDVANRGLTTVVPNAFSAVRKKVGACPQEIPTGSKSKRKTIDRFILYIVLLWKISHKEQKAYFATGLWAYTDTKNPRR